MTPESLISPDENKNCLNCGEDVSALFCSACGQKYETEPISLKQLSKQRWKKFQKDYQILFFTIWQLLQNPGKAIGEYWAGRHMTYYNPFNFFLLIGSLAAFIIIQFSTFSAEVAAESWREVYTSMGIPYEEEQISGMQIWLSWCQQHYNILFLVLTPFYALASLLIFRKRGHNYGQHLVIWFYLIGLNSLLTLPSLPFIDIANPLASRMFLISAPILFGLISWFFRTLFSLSWWKSILLSVWAYVLAQLLIIVVSIVFGIIFGLGLALMKKSGLL